MPLTDANCRNARAEGKLRKLSDGGGLQLWVHANGSKLWRYAYRFGGKQKLLALGAYPDVSLKAARHRRDDAAEILRSGRDPSIERKLAKASLRLETFKAIAEEYLDKLRREGRTEATMTKTEWLLRFAYPDLGGRRIAEIRPIEVLTVLRRVERRERYESARRLRSTIGAVFRYAVATARAESDPTVALQGALTSVRAKPRAAVTTPEAVGQLLRAIDGFEGQVTTRYALQLMALLFPRPGELRLAEWTEVALDDAVWSIPASRMKMRRPHRVPLAPQALATLKSLQRVTGDGRLLFPGHRSVERPISNNTMNAALRRMGYGKDEATAHGFRATASTLLNESGLWNPDAIERQLAHVEGNDVRRAYARGEHWDERVRMMAWWGNYLDRLKEGKKDTSRAGRPI